MTPRAGTLLGAALVALVLTGVGRAEALSCGRPRLWAPFPDTSNAPTNTRIWCNASETDDSAQILVSGPSGPLNGSVTQLSWSDTVLFVFAPDQELAPLTTYHVDCPVFDLGATSTFSFTTGEGPRHEPPPVPDLSRVELTSRVDGAYGPRYNARFERVVPPESIVVLDLEGEAKLAPADPSGRIGGARLEREDDYWTQVGWGPCGGNWPEAAPFASLALRAGAFDLTGAFSGWSESLTVTLPEAVSASIPLEPPRPDRLNAPASYPDSSEASHCQLGLRPGSSGPAALLVGLASLTLRRRHRSARSSN
jgi:hypothetical protein